MRSDEVNYDFDRETLLQTMPDTDAAGFLRVQAVFTDEGADE
jgi:Asp-tRNA(Asn)/Glu-tRNA(Gln) amidotransferase C subunit